MRRDRCTGRSILSDERRTESLAGPGPQRPEKTRPEILPFGSELAQRFEILEVLGSGGYAVVYRARDRSLDREVALKVLRHDRITPSALRRMRREAAIARDVVHERLVRIFDIEEDGEAVFLTMEVVEGGSLGERLSEGRIAIDRAVDWATQALEGLAALHALGILHRDVKPGNLLLTADDAIKVSDFGLALHLERDETRATTHESVLGTLEYLSPEQALGQEVDVRSDLYSLGVVLYETIAGRLPFETNSSLGSLLERIRGDRLPDLQEIRPETPTWLAATVAKLLARNPGERYASAEAALAELRSRSARRRLRASAKWIAAAGVAFLLGAAVTAAVGHSRSRFQQMAFASDYSIRALDRMGRTLWERDAINPRRNFVPIRTKRHGRVIAALLNSRDEQMSAATAYIDLLEPQTGESLERVLLPSAHHLFPGFADTYGGRLQAVDLDGDGFEEIVASLVQDPYFPSYNVLVELDLQRSRVVFASAGHHDLAAVADLDDDGRAELLFGGVDNRMGWSSGIAAVRIEPWVGQGTETIFDLPHAVAPDLFHGPDTRNLLHWYALLPSIHQYTPEARLTVDRTRRQLLYELSRTESVRLDFAGFDLATPSPLAPSRRQELRRHAYERMRDGQRLLAGKRPADAAIELASGLEAAREAADLPLSGWTERLLARATVLSGQVEEGIRRYSALHERSSARSEIAYEAARALHTVGETRLAVDWYRRGLGRGAGAGIGRNKYECAQDLALALVELGRFDEAERELAAFTDSFPNQKNAIVRAFVAWRAGGPLQSDVLDTDDSRVDLDRYLRLEMRFARADAPALLLGQVEYAIANASGLLPLFHGLEAELRARIDPAVDTLPQAHRALQQARLEALDEPEYRALIPLLEERVRRMETESRSRA